MHNSDRKVMVLAPARAPVRKDVPPKLPRHEQLVGIRAGIRLGLVGDMHLDEVLDRLSDPFEITACNIGLAQHFTCSPSKRLCVNSLRLVFFLVA